MAVKENNISHILKMYGISDDTILQIATEDTLWGAASLLRDTLPDKCRMTALEAMKVVKELREELR